MVLLRDVARSLFHELVIKQKRKDITAIRVGTKIKDGVDTGEPAIVFGVTEKLNRLQVYLHREHKMIPRHIKLKAKHTEMKVATDVEEVGPIKFVGFELLEGGPLTARVRPHQSGYSVGNPKITAGTTGILVEYNGKQLVDSNWHVLCYHEGKIGDPIIAPGSYDGGKVETDKVGELAVVLERPDQFSAQGKACYTDYALYRKTVEHTRKIPLLDVYPGGFREAEEKDKICWVGRTTGLGRGQVSKKHNDIQVDMGGGNVAYFYDTDYFYPAPKGGDSGSVMLLDLGDDKSKPWPVVGKVFAGSATIGVMIPERSIRRVYPGIKVVVDDGGNGDEPPAIEYVELFVKPEGGAWKSWGRNSIPDANDGLYRWKAASLVLGTSYAQTNVKLTGIAEPFSGELRTFKVVKVENGNNNGEPEYEADAVVVSPAENEELDISKEHVFAVRVEVKKRE